MNTMKRIAAVTAGLSAGMMSLAVWAQDGIEGLETVGKPHAEGIAFQPAATELARDLHWLEGMVNVIIIAVSLFVVALLAIIIVRFNQRVNKEPARFTHNTPIEITWTLVPILILIFIGSFSLPVLFKQQEIPEPEVIVKATGYQWYWGYEYPERDFVFDSILLARDELADYGYADDEYLLAVDNAMVVPVNKVVVVRVTGGDVIHSWTIPAFGVKQDAVPGRTAELWFKAEREGVYFGQCSELCGKDHAYMPITVKVVSDEVYAQWLDRMAEEYAGTPPAVTVAQAD